MRCHYDVLEVPQNADDSQIRNAYRKLALKWHPDKNFDDVNAKTEFQLVQQAYEVLRDPQERAWYDNHRKEILKGLETVVEDNRLNVDQYFTTKCFKGYGDDDGGFYAVYRKVFETLAKEDMEFMKDKEEFCDIPAFGTSSSSYNVAVGPFYAYWLGYSSKKSFAMWFTQEPQGEDLLNIPKRIYKVMENNKKKVWAKAKRKRTEKIRALVAFVRKRDRRAQEHDQVEEARILKNRLKQEELGQLRRLQRRKELSEAIKSEAEWVKFDNLKGQLREIEKELAKEFGEKLSDDDDDSESEFLGNSYCVACNKVFKTIKAFQNHEISKKHKGNVEKLQEYTMEEAETEEDENDENETDLNEDNADEEKEDNVLDEDLTEEEVDQVLTKKNKRKSKKVMKMNFSIIDHEDEHLQKVDVEEPRDQQVPPEDLVLTKNQKRRNGQSQASNKSFPNGSSTNNENLEKPRQNKKTKNGAKNLDDTDVAHCCMACQANFPTKHKLFDHLKKTGHGEYLTQNQMFTKNKKKSRIINYCNHKLYFV